MEEPPELMILTSSPGQSSFPGVKRETIRESETDEESQERAREQPIRTPTPDDSSSEPLPGPSGTQEQLHHDDYQPHPTAHTCTRASMFGLEDQQPMSRADARGLLEKIYLLISKFDRYTEATETMIQTLLNRPATYTTVHTGPAHQPLPIMRPPTPSGIPISQPFLPPTQGVLSHSQQASKFQPRIERQATTRPSLQLGRAFSTSSSDVDRVIFIDRTFELNKTSIGSRTICRNHQP